MNDDRQPPAAPGFRQAGIGSLVTRGCMGCGKNRLTTGGKGQGIRWRCAGCVETQHQPRRASGTT